MKKILLYAMLPLFLGCGSGESEEHADETVGKEIADDYNRQMDAARAVESQLEEQKQSLDDAIEASEQGDEEP